MTSGEFLIKVPPVARNREIAGGRVVSFYLGDLHVRALELFGRRHGHRSRAGALRAVLEVVAEAEAGPPKPNVPPGP